MSDKRTTEDIMQPLIRSRTFEESEMEITSMIDLTFLLLIFFLVAGKMDPSGQLQLPPARYGKPVVEKSSIILTLAAGEEGKAVVYCGNGINDQTRVRSGDLAVQEDEVANYVEKEFLAGAKENVLIKAGKGIKQREVWRISKAATRNEGVQQLYVAVTEVK
ncbi:MAG TPA: biopolymer transporter ExbD [Candidatus Anammoximicrobium sp.]|nr:biopolymer transporter ExbD [Candidatus Anammoximicrobium sp.]